MRKTESSGVNLQPDTPRTKRIGPRKRKRGESPSATSPYFQTAAKSSVRCSTSIPKIGSTSETRKNHTKICKNGTKSPPKIARERKIFQNEEDPSLDFSLFTENKSSVLVDMNSVTSDYFLRSPSSAYESVRSLGPLVYTWIGSSNLDEIRSNCLRKTSPTGSKGKPCEACSKILMTDAFQHFRDCPIFRRELDAFIVNQKFADYSDRVGENNCRPSCVELVGRWAEEHALRHLCPNQCFFRAFAPSRDWMVLRKNLKTYTPILNDWTCRLVHETKANECEIVARNNQVEKVKQDPEAKQLNSETTLNEHLPRTLFVSLKTGESFQSFQKGRCMLEEASVNNPLSVDRESKGLTFDEKYYKATELQAASPFGLIEELFANDPWRILISTMLLNKTQRKQNLDYILFHLFTRWPTADAVVKDADHDEEHVHLFVFSLVRPAGLGKLKSIAFVRLSREYLGLLGSKRQAVDENEDCRNCKRVEFELTRENVKQLFNCGDYAADAYQIFIRKDFKSPVLSNDRILMAYVEWKRSLSCKA